jgi:glycosyltransferase involved in cell wall biosynthesis
MRVLLVPSSSDLVGVAVHVYNLAKLLHADGRLDLVVCPRDGWLSKQLVEAGIPCTVIEISADPKMFLSASVAFARLLRERKNADIVHLHGRFPLFVSVLSLLMFRKYTFVTTVHQFTQRSADGLLGWKARVEALLLRHMRRICCVSDDLKSEIRRRVGIQKAAEIDVIPNWIEALWSDGGKLCRATDTKARSEGRRICAIGYLCQVKGFDILLRALSNLHQQGCKAHCDIFGEGPEKDNLLSLADRLGVSRCVSFRGPVGNLRCLLPDYDVVVVPSRSESFSMVALEAYDASVPVVASDIPGLRETVLDGQTGLLFESGNFISLAEKIRELFGSTTLANYLVANAKEHLQRYLPNEALKRSYVEFYGKAQAKVVATLVSVGD